MAKLFYPKINLMNHFYTLVIIISLVISYSAEAISGPISQSNIETLIGEQDKLQASYDYKEQLDAMVAERENMNLWLYYISILIVMLIATGVLFYFLKVRYFQDRLKVIETKLKMQNKAIKIIIDDEEKERINIANELYNGLGKVLSQAKMQIFLLEDEVRSEHRPLLEDTLDLLERAESKAINLSKYLIPGELVHSGLIPAVNDLIESMIGEKPLKVTFKYYDYAIQPPLETEVALYRIIQEILSNAVKHNEISHIIIVLKSNGSSINLDVVDDGNGKTLADFENENEAGWLNLHTRIDMLNGALIINRGESHGTSIKVELIS
jgi:two-component system, NarL family, sensor kinase